MSLSVAPAGYAKMTDMLTGLSGGKLLVILEGGYNLLSISASATSVIKVLLGESLGCELDNASLSISGLLTVLEVLEIQRKYWSILASNIMKLESQARMHFIENQRKLVEKKRRAVAPMWWKWGRKGLMYHFLNGRNRHVHMKRKGV